MFLICSEETPDSPQSEQPTSGTEIEPGTSRILGTVLNGDLQLVVLKWIPFPRVVTSLCNTIMPTSGDFLPGHAAHRLGTCEILKTGNRQKDEAYAVIHICPIDSDNWSIRVNHQPLDLSWECHAVVLQTRWTVPASPVRPPFSFSFS
jgi:hypothetical protein